MTDDDEKLKRAFGALEREDARKVPTFEAIRRRPKRRRSPWIVALPIASLGAAAGAMLIVWANYSMAPEAAAPSSASGAELGTSAGGARASDDVSVIGLRDPAPLDFLLDLPGSSALAATTSFDAKVFR